MYSASIPNAVIRTETGLRVQIPTARLRQCIDRTGLVGRFKLTVDESHKIISFTRIT